MMIHPIDCSCDDCTRAAGDEGSLRVTIIVATVLVVAGLASFFWGLIALVLRLF